MLPSAVFGKGGGARPAAGRFGPAQAAAAAAQRCDRVRWQMCGDTPKPGPPAGSVDEDTVLGQPGVMPSSGCYTKPFLLQQIAGPGAPRDIVLDLDELVVGRSHQAHICIDSARLSRKHMALRRSGVEYVCADLDSANGLFLNGVKAHSAVLREGDTIQIGEVVFIYHEGS
jgi:hypothetical protein